MANKQSGSDDKSMPTASGQPALPSVGGERLSMSDYQTLTHLLERAGRESRLRTDGESSGADFPV